MSRRRLQLLLAWAGLLALGASIYLGPYFAAWSIREAVASGDAEALDELVDFESVRENLKGELRRTVSASRRARDRAAGNRAAEADSEPEPDLGSQLAVAVGEAMIDRFVSPEGMDRALRDRPVGATGWSLFLDLGSSPEGAGGVSVSAGYEGWNDFTVRLGVASEGDDPDADSDADPIWADILFERRGIWAWRVTGARVSPRAIPALTR